MATPKQSFTKEELEESIKYYQEELDFINGVLELQENAVFNRLFDKITHSVPQEMLANAISCNTDETSSQLKDSIAAARSVSLLMSRFTKGNKEQTEEAIAELNKQLRRLR